MISAVYNFYSQESTCLAVEVIKEEHLEIKRFLKATSEIAEIYLQNFGDCNQARPSVRGLVFLLPLRSPEIDCSVCSDCTQLGEKKRTNFNGSPSL